MERRKNVYELVQERLDMIFKEFDNIYVSFSGGKDSGVLLNLCIDYIRKHNLKRKIGVFHLDYEIQCKYSINSLVYWVTYVHNVVYSFYRSMIYCYINSTKRCAGFYRS